MSQDLTKAKIYKITNDFNNEVYIGSTCNTLIKRFSMHVCESRKDLSKDRCLYKLINEIGETRFRIELIEDYPCEDRYQLRQREGHFIREMGTLNMVIAGRTKHEYRENNKDIINEKNRDYRNQNKHIMKEYREQNKEKLKQQTKEYKETHKDKIDEMNKQYRLEKRDKFKERNSAIILCACGCSITFVSKQRHEKTKKHIQLMESLSI